MSTENKLKEELIKRLAPAEMAETLVKDITALAKDLPKAVSTLIKEKKAPTIAPQFKEFAKMRAKADKQVEAVAKKYRANQKERTEVLQQTIEKRKKRVEAYAIRKRSVTTTKKDAWIVAGQITDKSSGLGVANVTVNAYDMDRKIDDYLGSTRTDALGYYRIEYTERDFKDKGDKQPETFIVVLDDKNNKLYTSPKSFIEKSKPATRIDAVIDGAKVPEKMTISNNINGYIKGKMTTWTNRNTVLTNRKAITTKENVRKKKRHGRKR